MNIDERATLVVVNPALDAREIREKARYSRAIEVSLEEFAESTTGFFSALETIASEAKRKLGEFDVDEIEVHATLTVSGKMGIVGIVEGGGEGAAGLKFVLKRAKSGGFTQSVE